MSFKQVLYLIFLTGFVFGCNEVKPDKKLLDTVDSLQQTNDSLRILLENPVVEESLQENLWYYPKSDSRHLLASGIENPQEFIENSLREQTELIPMQAVLGGTMHFGKIQILGREWLIADFEDGHVYGRAIFKYRVNKKHEIEFEVIAFSEN